jgi:ABC-type sugar transport system permease subunit
MTLTMTRPARKAPGAAPPAGRHRRHRPWLYLAPALILLITFTYVPVGNMVFYSFHDWDGLDRTMDPAGWDNYVRVFTDERYWRVFLISLYYFAASFAQIAIALYFAVVLSFRTRFRNLFKGIIFFPYLLNGVAVGFVFLYLFQPGGTLDSVLTLAGLSEHTRQWLGDPDVANLSLAGTSVWRFTGLNFVLFLGAIQSIPAEIYEASEIDGANRWHQFVHIIAPGIRRIISLSFILAVSGSLAVFEIPFIMTGGANGTRTFVIQAYETAFQFRQIGLASAMAVVLLLVVLLLTWIQRKVLPDDEVTLT